VQLFHHLHADVLRHYEQQGLLAEVSATGDIEAIYAGIVNALGTDRK
jgi:adenylate kinase family enzyme